MWNISIPIICVVAHLYLVVIFLPSFWREIDERGFRWHTALNLFVVPSLIVVLIANHVLGNLSTVPDWLLIVAFITIDALIVGMVLAGVALRRRKRAAREARESPETAAPVSSRRRSTGAGG